MYLNNEEKKEISLVTLADEFASKGLIPEDFKQEFAEGLERQLKRESRRFGCEVGSAVVGAMRMGRMAQGLAA